MTVREQVQRLRSDVHLCKLRITKNRAGEKASASIDRFERASELKRRAEAEQHRLAGLERQLAAMQKRLDAGEGEHPVE